MPEVLVWSNPRRMAGGRSPQHAHRRLAGWRRTTAVLALAAGLLAAGCGDGADAGDAAAKAQTITFQKPESPGPDPFTRPADVEGDEQVELETRETGASTPFGGSGSNRVCDRDKLIRFLEDEPDRMREWAQVLRVKPTARAVRRYIAKLHPVTLTRDTPVTNHAFRDGRAVPFQAILAAGTAVLVDGYGVPVVRCFCGNPLLPAVLVKTAVCTGCPPDYEPPRPCRFSRRRSFDEVTYRRRQFSNGEYDEVFIRRHRRSPYARCYAPYPDPPTVRIVDVFPAPDPTPEPSAASPPPAAPAAALQCDPPRSQLEFERCAQAGRIEPPDQSEPEDPQATAEPTFDPAAGFTPRVGSQTDTYTLSVSGFPPNTQLTIALTRPDGVRETYGFATGPDGTGSHTFPPAGSPVPGVYTAVVSGGGVSATASTTVVEDAG